MGSLSQEDQSMDPSLLEHLLHVRRLYSAQSPSSPAKIQSPPLPNPHTLCLPEVQEWLVDYLVQDPLLVKWPGSKNWRRAFWKRVVKEMEEGLSKATSDDPGGDYEVDERILLNLMDLMTESEYLHPDRPSRAPTLQLHKPTSCFRTYLFNDRGTSASVPIPGPSSHLILKEEEASISRGTTGLRTWQASIRLANHILANQAMIRSKRILELGSGTGLVSLTCAKLATSAEGVAKCADTGPIWVTDFDEDVLERLRENVRINDMGNLVEVRSLDWTHVADKREDVMRWIKDEVKPDVVLATDVVYDPSIIPSLVGCLEQILMTSCSSNNSGPVAYVAATIRNEDTWRAFIDEIGRERKAFASEFKVTEEDFRPAIDESCRWSGEIVGGYDEELETGAPVKLVKISTSR